MSNPVRWGVLGAANIAVNRVIPAMQAAQGAHVMALASRDGDKARSAAFRLGIERSYGSYEALLADPDIEAVYIPLPNPLHVPWSLKALAAGKHVLCEKPIAMTAAEASQLVEARDRTGRVIEEAFSFPNHPQWAFIRKTLDEGDLGELRAVTGVLAYNNANAADIRNDPAAGGGALYDIGSYLINACRIAFGGEPSKVIGLFDRDPAFGIDRLTSALLQFRGGHAALTVATQAGPSIGGTHQHLGLLCSKGWMRAEFPFAHSTPTPCNVYIGEGSGRGSIATRRVHFDAVNQYTAQTERFCRLVRGQEAQAWPIEHAVGNMKVIDALFRSEASGTWETP